MTASATKKAAAPAAALAIESWDIERLVPYLGNARRLSDRAVEVVAASLREFGWRQPIVVDKRGVVIAGHTRLKAAQSLGLLTVPVHVAKNLTQAQADAYRLMDNRSGDESDWNQELLGPQLAKLDKATYDLALTGFSQTELNAYLRAIAPPPSPGKGKDETPRLPDGRFRSAGAVWLLGNHYLVCGLSDKGEVDAIVKCWQKFTGEKARLQE